MKSLWASRVLLLLLLSGLASAQSNTGPLTGHGAAISTSPPASVQNAPFSADTLSIYDRTLENGGHIHHETRGKIFRDSQGRVRTETDVVMPLPAEKVERVTIQDPVEQAIVTLYPKSKTATISYFGQAAGTPSRRPNGMAGGVVTFAGPGGASTTAPLGNTAVVAMPAIKTEPLGTKSIEGVSAVGTRTTRTMEVGRTDNDKPVVAVTDSWISRDLQVTVLTETDDGQAGHSMMKMVNIVRKEPDAQLFRVPADYALKDANSVAVQH